MTTDDTPAFLSWRIWDGTTTTARVLSVTAYGWRLQSADGVAWLTDTRPRGSWEADPLAEHDWQERHARFAPVAG